MSKRKKHTEILDFMRIFMAYEINRYCGFFFFNRRMINKLEKRGWIVKKRSPSSTTGKFCNIRQRRNYYETTPKGRRVIYRLDRHSDPKIQEHRFNRPSYSHFSNKLDGYVRDRYDEMIVETNKRTTNLHKQQVKRYK